MVALKCMMLQSIVASPLSDLHEIQTLVADLERDRVYEAEIVKNNRIQHGFANHDQKNNGKCDGTSEAGYVADDFGWTGSATGDVETMDFIDACLIMQDGPGEQLEWGTYLKERKKSKGKLDYSTISVKPKASFKEETEKCEFSAAKGAGKGGICNLRRYVFDIFKTDQCKDMALYAVKTAAACQNFQRDNDCDDPGVSRVGCYKEDAWNEGEGGMPYPHCISDYWNAADAAKLQSQKDYREQMAICGAWNPDMDAVIKIQMHEQFSGQQVLIGPGQSATTEVCQANWGGDACHWGKPRCYTEDECADCENCATPHDIKDCGKPFESQHTMYNPDETYKVEEAKQILFCAFSKYGYKDRHAYDAYEKTDFKFEWNLISKWSAGAHDLDTLAAQ